jgi:hypothetical protein
MMFLYRWRNHVSTNGLDDRNVVSVATVLVIVGLDRGEGHRGRPATGIDIDILGGKSTVLVVPGLCVQDNRAP